MPGHRNWTVLWKTVTRVETGKIIPWIALRNTIGVTAPLIAGVLLGQVSAGLVMGMGALNVSFSDGKDPYQQRALRMLQASVFCGLAVIIGASTGRTPVTATLVAACWAFASGMMVALGSTPADIGTVSLVVLVVFAAQPMTPRTAALSGLMALAGGLFQTLLSVMSWLHSRYEPERRALAQVFAGLKQMIVSHVDADVSPPVTAQTNEAGQALQSLTRDYSLESEVYLSLLTQAERARLSILAIKRLRARMRRESMVEGPEVLDRILTLSAHICGEVRRLLVHEVLSIHVGAQLDLLQAMAKVIPVSNDDGPASSMARDARFQAAALAGQLRSAVSLASHSIGPGQGAFQRQEARKPLALQLTSALAVLHANLSLRSPAFRHALRLACCVGLGVALGRGAGLVRPYWIPMTIAIVLKPDFTTTFSRGVLRLAGTYAGLLIATGLFHIIHPDEATQVALLAVFIFLCRCFGPANYGILTTAVSGLVVLLIALTGVAPQPVIGARALNTTIGGLMALIAYTVWPTWESTQLPEAMAALLDAYRQYVRELTRVYAVCGAGSNPGEPQDEQVQLQALRLQARLARSNMEASVERYRAEPGASAGELKRIMSMLASSHRFVHACMSLEAELTANPLRTIPPGFCAFFDYVDRTLDLLARTLRGARPAESDFPGLREIHTQLLQSGGSAFALLSTETDRITNSLNTLHEQIGAWTTPSLPPEGVQKTSRK